MKAFLALALVLGGCVTDSERAINLSAQDHAVCSKQGVGEVYAQCRQSMVQYRQHVHQQNQDIARGMQRAGAILQGVGAPTVNVINQ